MYNFDEKVDRVSEKCRKWDISIIKDKFGDVIEDFIPMWIADMDFKMPQEIARTFLEAVNRGVLGYTYCYDEFYDAVINWQRDMHKIEVKREWITLTYGTVSTIHYVIQAFCEKGDKILMNTPVYDPFDSAAEKQQTIRIYNTLDIKDNRYYLNFDKLKESLKKYKPKLYLFCSPHNPSGRIWSIDEIKQAAQLCKENGTILIVDEVHAEHIHYGKFESVLSLEKDLADNVILLTSPNKAFNLGGLKTSYSIIVNKEIRDKFRKKLSQNSITSPNVFGILGIIAAYNDSRIWLEEVNKYIKDNYELLESFIKDKLPLLKVMKMESSYLAWIDIKNMKITSSEFTKKLAIEQGVLVEDGSHFVKDGEGYIRINLGTQRSNVEEALLRIYKMVENIN